MSKQTSMNSKLLPQGSGGVVGGRNSVLLQGNGPRTRQSSFGSGIDPPGQIPMVKPTAPQPTISNVKPEELKRKTTSLLEEYFSIRLLDEAIQCIIDLKSPSYHSQIVKEVMNLGLDKSPPCVEPVAKLLEYLVTKNVFTARDTSTGCLLYGEMINDIAIDLPKAPNNFCEILGKLILTRAINFGVVKEILQKIEDEIFRKPIFHNAVNSLLRRNYFEIRCSIIRDSNVFDFMVNFYN